METTISLAREHDLAALTLAAVIFLGASTNGQLAALRTGMAALRVDMNEEFKAVRSDMNEEFKAVRSEIADTNERLARVETRLDSIEDRLYMDTALTPM